MRTAVELAVATGIDPGVIAQLDGDTFATLLDVVIERNKPKG